MNPNLFEFSETLVREFFKNESITFLNFRKLWYGNFFKMNPDLFEFLETLEDFGNVKLGIWKIGNMGNDILKVKLHVENWKCRK